MLGHFWMIGEDTIITFERQSDHSPACIAKLKHGCYQGLPLTGPYQIYNTARDVSQQALGHLSTGLWSTATDIYPDISILPKRTRQFVCPACAKYTSKHAVPEPISNLQSNNTVDLIHADLLAALSFESLGHCKYILTFVEYKPRYTQVNFLHNKSDAPRLMKAFCQKEHATTPTYSEPSALTTEARCQERSGSVL